MKNILLMLIMSIGVAHSANQFVWGGPVSVIQIPTPTPTITATPTITVTPVVSFTPTLTPTATFTPTFQSVVVVSADVYSPVTVNLNHYTNGLELMMTESVNLTAGGTTFFVNPMPLGQSYSANYYAIYFSGTASNTFQDFVMPIQPNIRSFNRFIIRPQVTATQTVVITYVINLNIPGPFSFNPTIESQRHAWNNYVPWWKVILG